MQGGTWGVSCLERCPQFRSVLIEREREKYPLYDTTKNGIPTTILTFLHLPVATSTVNGMSRRAVSSTRIARRLRAK